MVADTLRLDPVLVLRDPDIRNYWLRLAAANAIQRKRNEQNKKRK